MNGGYRVVPESAAATSSSARPPRSDQGAREDSEPVSQVVRRASDSLNAAISSPLRTSRMSPTSTGWFQVLPSIAGNRATSVN